MILITPMGRSGIEGDHNSYLYAHFLKKSQLKQENGVSEIKYRGVNDICVILIP